MQAQTNVHYLVCTKNRGFHRKHIDVCKQCVSNDVCREYQEFLRMEPVRVESIHPDQNRVAISMAEFIEKLAELRQLVGDGTSGHRMLPMGDVTSRPNVSMHRFLRTELKSIKSLCQPDIASPAS